MEDLALPELEYKGTGASVPFRNSGIKKSLETIVSDSKKKKRENVLVDMVSDRAKNLKAAVIALLEEIQLREELNRCQFEKIDGELCRLKNRILQYDSFDYQSLEGLDRAKVEAKSQLESDVFELERERRKESLECWRDLMFLKKYLMVSLKDYWELVRRWRVLRNQDD